MLEIEEYDSFRAVNPEKVTISETILTEDFDDLQAATQSLPQIEKAELEIEIAAKEMAIAKAALYPTLTLTGGYGSSYSDARQKVRMDATGNPVMNANNELLYANYPWLDQIRDNASAYISLGLNIPIFNGRQAKNKVRTSRIARQRAEYNLLLARKELDKQIQQALWPYKNTMLRRRRSQRTKNRFAIFNKNSMLALQRMWIIRLHLTISPKLNLSYCNPNTNISCEKRLSVFISRGHLHLPNNNTFSLPFMKRFGPLSAALDSEE